MVHKWERGEDIIEKLQLRLQLCQLLTKVKDHLTFCAPKYLFLLKNLPNFMNNFGTFLANSSNCNHSAPIYLFMLTKLPDFFNSFGTFQTFLANCHTNFPKFQAPSSLLRPYPPIQHEDGLETSIRGLEFRVTQASFLNEPGNLSLRLKCVSSVSTSDPDSRSIETHHREESTHFSLGSLFHSGNFKDTIELVASLFCLNFAP